MIERHWHGKAKKPLLDTYFVHLQTDTFPQLRALDGFIDAKVLQGAQQGSVVDIVVITIWDSIEAIEKFSGGHLELAVVPEAAQKCFYSFDKHVVHYSRLALE